MPERSGKDVPLRVTRPHNKLKYETQRRRTEHNKRNRVAKSNGPAALRLWSPRPGAKAGHKKRRREIPNG